MSQRNRTQPTDTKAAPVRPVRKTVPYSVVILGRLMFHRGTGKYPYECEHKDKSPNAEIYYGASSWIADDDPLFISRDRRGDNIDPTIDLNNI